MFRRIVTAVVLPLILFTQVIWGAGQLHSSVAHSTPNTQPHFHFGYEHSHKHHNDCDDEDCSLDSDHDDTAVFFAGSETMFAGSLDKVKPTLPKEGFCEPLRSTLILCTGSVNRFPTGLPPPFWETSTPYIHFCKFLS